MGERVIDPKFNIHKTYRRVNIINPYRFGEGGGGELPPEVPTDFQVVDWRFDELSGKLIDHISGLNADVYGSMARTGSYYGFNGTNTYLQTESGANLLSLTNSAGTDPFTLRIKFRVDTIGSNGAWIIAKRDSSTSEYQVSILSGVFAFGLSTSSGWISKSIDQNYLPLGVDNHLVVTYDGSKLTSGIKMFLNKSDAYVTSSGPTTVNDVSISNAQVMIGEAPFGSTSRKLNGRLYNIRVDKGYAWNIEEIANDFGRIM